MATEEVGIRLSLQGRREVAAGLSGTSKELERVEDSAQDVESAGRDAARGLEKASDRRFAKGFARIRRGAAGLAGFLGRGLVTAAKAGAVALGAATVAAGALSLKAIGLAADSAETGSAFRTVLGPAARGVQKDLDRLTKRFGTYNPDLQAAATGFAVMGKEAGKNRKELKNFSTDLVRAGLDLGSFWNKDSKDVFKALQSGLVGESEPLKQFGIQMSVASLDAFALAEGLKKTTGEMTEQEKIGLRQAFILANLGDAQGDLVRTQKSFANQQRAASDRTKTFLDLLGGPMMTAGTGAFQGLNSILLTATKELRSRMPAIQAGAERLSERFSTLGKTWAQDLPGAIDTLVGKWDTFKGSFSGFSAGDTGAQLGSIRDSLGAIGAALGSVDWGAVKDGLGQGVADTVSVFSVVIGFAADHVDTLAQYLPGLVVAFAAYKTAQAAANVAALAHLPIQAAHAVALIASARANGRLAAQMGLATGATKKATLATKIQTLAQKGLNFVMKMNPIAKVIAVVSLLVAGFVLAYKKSDTFRGIVDKVWAALKVAWEWIKRAGAAVGTWIVDKFQLGVEKVKNIRDAIGGFIDKIRDAIGWVRDLGEKIKNIPGVGFLGDVAGGIFGGGRATGGTVRAGVTYLVGERGPEFFTPGLAGRVDPPTVTPVTPVSPAVQPARVEVPAMSNVDRALEAVDRETPVSMWPRESDRWQVFLDGRELYNSWVKHASDEMSRR
jgi:hypothetical protein